MVFSIRPQFLANQITSLESKKLALSEEVNALLRTKKELNETIVHMNAQISQAKEKFAQFTQKESELKKELDKVREIGSELLAQRELLAKKEQKVKQAELDAQKIHEHAKKYLTLAKQTIAESLKREKELAHQKNIDSHRHAHLVTQFTAFKARESLFARQEDALKKQHTVLLQKEQQLRSLASDLAKYQHALHQQRIELDAQRKELKALTHSR